MTLESPYHSLHMVCWLRQGFTDSPDQDQHQDTQNTQLLSLVAKAPPLPPPSPSLALCLPESLVSNPTDLLPLCLLLLCQCPLCLAASIPFSRPWSLSFPSGFALTGRACSSGIVRSPSLSSWLLRAPSPRLRWRCCFASSHHCPADIARFSPGFSDVNHSLQGRSSCL